LEHLGYSTITVDPIVYDQYKETTTNDIMALYTERITDELMYDIYLVSPFFEKYEQNYKKIERLDLYPIYEYFRNELRKQNQNLNIIQIMIAIFEFFELNYDKMYKDVIPIKDKSEILQTLQDVYGYKSKLNCLKLF
jgi:hypothetical protein